MSTEPSHTWNLRTIRQALRVLGAQPSWVGDVQSTARAQRVVRDMLERRGIATEMFHVPGSMPLVVAGDGPILIVTFLDDSSESAQRHLGAPPAMNDGLASAPGIIRKAGVLAAVGALSGATAPERAFTLVVESDRHRGSVALEQWLERTGRRFEAGLCEIVDLPVAAPAIFSGASGRILLSVRLERPGHAVEDVYGGIVPDLGHEMAAIIASLKTLDSEIVVPGFYDSVAAPTTDDIDQLDDISPTFGGWLDDLNQFNERPFNERHAAMAVFFAPSLVTRSIQVPESGPFLPAAASAVVDIRLAPGQQPVGVLRMVTERIQSIAPRSEVSTVLMRPPVSGMLRDRVSALPELRAIPVAPGDTPAGLLEERGTPSLGYSVVSRAVGSDDESIELSRIAEGTESIRRIARQIVPLRAREAP